MLITRSHVSNSSMKGTFEDEQHPSVQSEFCEVASTHPVGWEKEIEKHDFVGPGNINFFVSCHFRKLGNHVELLGDKGECFGLSMRLQLLWTSPVHIDSEAVVVLYQSFSNSFHTTLFRCRLREKENKKKNYFSVFRP